jgi:hypothetical protein
MPTVAVRNETSQALPSAWIDRLFERFALMYGNQWLAKWQGLDLAAVKASWAADLAFASADQIRKALEHCKARQVHPPSSPEFVGLCRSFAPAMDTRSMLEDQRKGDIPDGVRQAIAEFLTPGRKRDPRDWAREILALHAEGKCPHLYGVMCAKRALGMAA